MRETLLLSAWFFVVSIDNLCFLRRFMEITYFWYEVIDKTLRFGDPLLPKDFASNGFFVGLLPWKASLNASGDSCS